MIKKLKRGLIYRNPKPHVKSIHAYFPSVAVMANGEILATLALGEAFESTNLRTHIARSSDNGESWQVEGAIYPGTFDRLTSDFSRVTALADKEVLVFMARHDRTEHPDEGLTNPKTLGFVPTTFLILRSRDYGHRWTTPEKLEPPLSGPEFEICCPITPLKDGRWILPTSTWRGWSGECPHGMKMVALVSHDRGVTWPEYMDVMADQERHIIYWESKIIELPDGRLMATAWAYDEKKAQDLPNQYVLSRDGGKTWSRSKSTGLIGQTLTPFSLGDGRVLCVYRRIDKTGLWANISHLKGDKWINDYCEPLWGHRVSGLTGSSRNMVDNFNILRFGAPCITRLKDKNLFVAFWCYEECISVIRWFKFQLK